MGWGMWLSPPAPLTTAQARAQLLSLGALLRGRRPPRSPEALLQEVPPLLQHLKGRAAALEPLGLCRAERVAATQLLVELHDAWQGGADTAALQAAVEAFCLRAATLAAAAPEPAPADASGHCQGHEIREGRPHRGGVPLCAPTLRLYRLSCASAQSRSACATR